MIFSAPHARFEAFYWYVSMMLWSCASIWILRTYRTSTSCCRKEDRVWTGRSIGVSYSMAICVFPVRVNITVTCLFKRCMVLRIPSSLVFIITHDVRFFLLCSFKSWKNSTLMIWLSYIACWQPEAIRYSFVNLLSSEDPIQSSCLCRKCGWDSLTCAFYCIVLASAFAEKN